MHCYIRLEPCHDINILANGYWTSWGPWSDCNPSVTKEQNVTRNKVCIVPEGGRPCLEDVSHQVKIGDCQGKQTDMTMQ